MSSPPKLNRIIVVGASAGGPDALQTLVADLDADLPAAILVVQHIGPNSPRALAQLLEMAGSWPATYARNGESLEAGRILIAPPDHHLVVRNGGTTVTRGPRENRSRPSIDVLFRSAAVAGGGRTVGVLLTGMLDDGVVGLEAIHRCGGVTIVQDPSDAAFPHLVQQASEAVPVDHSLPLSEIAGLLNRLSREPAPVDAEVPTELQLEVEIGMAADSSDGQRQPLGRYTDFSCPDCGGRLQRTNGGALKHYICEVGHAFNESSLLSSQDREIERALYVALRTLEERTRMLQRMYDDEEAAGRTRSTGGLRERIEETRADSASIRRLLLQRRATLT